MGSIDGEVGSLKCTQKVCTPVSVNISDCSVARNEYLWKENGQKKMNFVK